MVYTIKDAKNIYLWEGVEPTEEYVMLSDWGSVNKFNEFTLYGRQCVNDATTYWQWYVYATDTWWVYYKQFDKKIVWFNFIGATTNNNYDSFWFHLMPANPTFSSWNINNPQNELSFWASSKVYSGSSTWHFWCNETVSWTGTQFFSQNKDNATTRVTFEWVLENWVWNISMTTWTWQTWTATRTPNSVNADLYCVGINSWRRYTWQAGNFYQLIVTLQW